MTLGSALRRQWTSLSFMGLASGTLFFAASLTPSLLPRPFFVQGVLSGFAFAVGYACGFGGVLLWQWFELPRPGAGLDRTAKRLTAMAVAATVATFLWRAAIWQTSIRERMELPPVESAYPLRTCLIAVLVAAVLILIARLILFGCRLAANKLRRVLPPRVATALGTLVVVALVLSAANKFLLKSAFHAADAVFLNLDRFVDEGMEPPAAATACGSPDSLVPWDTIGKQGKDFLVGGPTQQALSEFWQRDVPAPLRVYVGLSSRTTPAERAELALQELVRVGGFERSVLVVATPTGTGWLDPGGVDTVEYLHAGDTAIVSMQYSYLPSWMTIMVDPDRSRVAARALFDAIYDHWRALPADARPRLYLHGLSLGALGSEASADLVTIFEDPIQGALWSGAPFPSRGWASATARRNPDSPAWLPRFRDGAMLRFTGRECTLDQAAAPWGRMRFVYIQHASDPMIFFSPDLLYRSPAWLEGSRGPDVSPYLKWFPLVTFLQIAFDLPLATTVPVGYGHNYAPSTYIDGWIAVTAPTDWDESDTERLKRHFSPERSQPQVLTYATLGPG